MESKKTKGETRMPDSTAKKEWFKTNSTMVTVKMMNKGDADILEYLKDKPKATTIKRALRLLIETEKKEAGE